MSVDDHCAGDKGCDFSGGKLASHEEVEKCVDQSLRDLDKVLRPTLRKRYNRFMETFEENHPNLYQFLTELYLPY